MKSLMGDIAKAASDVFSRVKHVAARWEQQLAEASWALDEPMTELGATAIDDLKEAVRNAAVNSDEHVCCGRCKRAKEDVSEEEAQEVAEAALEQFGELIEQTKADPEGEVRVLKAKPTTADLEEALLGIRRAQEVLDHLKFGVKRQRPGFALDFGPDGPEVEKTKLLHRLEDLAAHPKLIDDIANDDPDFPEAILEAARKVVDLRKARTQGAMRWDVEPEIEKLIEKLYDDGVRDPYGMRGSLSALYAKKYRFKRGKPAPMVVRTKDYDVTQRYKEGDVLYALIQDGQVRLTTQETPVRVGVVITPPSENDPHLEASFNVVE